MQIYIIVVLLLHSGAVSGGLEIVLKQAEFIADIYQQFPHSCIFILNSEAQQQGEDLLHSNYINCVILVNRNLLTDTLRSHAVSCYIKQGNLIWNYIALLGGM
jgi:hypothetical protein